LKSAFYAGTKRGYLKTIIDPYATSYSDAENPMDY